MKSAAADEDREAAKTPFRTVVLVLTALLVAVAVLYALLFDGGDDYKVTAEFENASQLVAGNEVVIGGARVGTVGQIDLGPDGQALVTFSVDDAYAPLHRGVIATIRSPSLSQIAGRQVQLTLPATTKQGEEIPSGGRLTPAETVSAVDLDQIFNTLSPKTIKDFKRVIQGFDLSYEGVGKQANKGLRYLNPFLSTSRRVLGELSSDEPALESLIVDSSRLSGAVADRAPDVSALVGNLNRMMGAIGARRTQLAEAVGKLPGFLRLANTTFVNLRATLDDVDPLVDAAKPVAVRLQPFLTSLRAAADDAVPTVSDLDAIVKRPGTDNDLVELTKLQPKLTARAVGTGAPDCGAGPDDPKDLQTAADDDFGQGAFGESRCALQNSLGALSYFRAYTPELTGWWDDFSTSGVIDANGGFARIPAVLNTFTASSPGFPQVFTPPQTPAQQLGLLTTGASSRCPGANERDPGDGSVPFTDFGALTDGKPGDCDPTQLPPGP